MSWYDKIELWVNLLLILSFFVAVVIEIASKLKKPEETNEDEGEEPFDEYEESEELSSDAFEQCLYQKYYQMELMKYEKLNEDIIRLQTNAEVERKGWESIGAEQRQRIDALQDEKAKLQLECDRLKMLLKQYEQEKKVLTVEDFQKETDCLVQRLEKFLCEQDEILGAYTTGRFLNVNVEVQQEKVENLSKAEASMRDALIYITRANCVCKDKQ